MAIYIKIKKKDTPREFLEEMFEGSHYTFKHATYFDEECTKWHCRAHAMRSFDDLHEIMQTYYPEVDEKEMMHLLLSHVPKGIYKWPQLSNCSTMRRIRFIYYSEDAFLSSIKLVFSPNGVYKYDSKYNWIQLLALLDIHTEEQLIKYVKKYYAEKEEIAEV